MRIKIAELTKKELRPTNNGNIQYPPTDGATCAVMNDPEQYDGPVKLCDACDKPAKGQSTTGVRNVCSHQLPFQPSRSESNDILLVV